MAAARRNAVPGVLVIPATDDAERAAVGEAWSRAGGDVVRLGRFWQPPQLDREQVRLYGNDTFCLVVAEVLGLELVSPPEDLVLRVEPDLLGREVGTAVLGEASSLRFPRFVKPMTPKQFPAAVYDDVHALEAVTVGLDPAEPVLHAEPVAFDAEARVFVLDGEAVATGLYEGAASLDGLRARVSQISGGLELPRTYVLDFGKLDGRWALIEANATWGAGLNGCDPTLVVACIAAATRARASGR